MKRMGYFHFEGVNPSRCQRFYGGTMTDRERRAVLAYMNEGVLHEQYMGFATSRMDGSILGTRCMKTPDEKWRFPEEWNTHYIMEHGLRPSRDFIDDALMWWEKA